MRMHWWTMGAVLALGACKGEPKSPPATLESLQRLAGGTPATAAAAPAPQFSVSYRLSLPTSDSALMKSIARRFIQQSGILEEVAATLNRSFRLRRNVPIVMGSCGGDANAFYSPQTGGIQFCDEFVILFDRLLSDGRPPEQARTAIVYATAFFTLHEAGHALADQLELPLTGGEENAVDQFATWILLTGDERLERMAVEGASTFAEMYFRRDPGKAAMLPYWDEHAYPEQRWVNINCLVYGSDPARYYWMTTTRVLDARRAVRCPDEWAKVDRNFTTLLAPHRQWSRGTGLIGADGKPAGAPGNGPLTTLGTPLLTRKKP